MFPVGADALKFLIEKWREGACELLGGVGDDEVPKLSHS
jgi:hypothetical protein